MIILPTQKINLTQKLHHSYLNSGYTKVENETNNKNRDHSILILQKQNFCGIDNHFVKCWLLNTIYDKSKVT